MIIFCWNQWVFKGNFSIPEMFIGETINGVGIEAVITVEVIPLAFWIVSKETSSTISLFIGFGWSYLG